MKIIPPGSLLAAAATVWLAVAAVWPARADAVQDEEGETRSYTLAEKSIQHAKENLPRQIDTENPELTKLAHDLYIDCTFDKLWEPALPGLPYRFFSISGAGDASYGKCQLLWDTMFILNAWAPLDDNELVCDVFRNYWNVIDNNPEAPKGSYRYGMVPCTTKPDLPQDGFSQIPILAWGCLMVFNQTDDRALLDLCLPYLDIFLTWYATERDVDNDGLIEYGAYKKCSIADIVQTARFETFDFAAPLDDLKLTEHPTRGTGGAWYGNIEGVDQTCFLAMSERAMIEMCQRTGRIEMMKKYERNLAKRTEAIRAKMWDPETKFFYSLDRDTDKQIRIRTLQGFLPLTAGMASEKQAGELVKQLTDPSLFWSKYPVTTSAMNEPTFRPDGFWRGDMWPPTNYLIALGLNRYGYYDVAMKLADRIFELVKKYDGHAYERYNGVEGLGLGVKDYCWGVTTWSIAVNTIYGIQEDYRTIVVPPDAKGRRLKLGKLEVNYPTDTSVELKTAFQREFKVIFPDKNAEIKVQCDGTTVKSVSVTGAVSEVTFTALPGKTYIVSKSEPFSERPLTVKGGRFLTLNTVIRVNQIEAARNMNEGTDEAAVHTPETVAAFRDAVSKGFPGAKVTWAFSWLALQDQRTNYTAIRKQVVGYHEKYGDEITFIPGGFFAPMYSTRAQVNQDIKEALQKIRDMVGDGYKPKSIVAGFLAAENMRYLAEEEGIHVCQGTIWSQYGIDNGDGDGSVSYPYYPSREHGCKPAQGKADFIDCVNLDGWTCDFLCARRFGFEGGFNSRLGVGPIESYRNLGVEKGMAEVMAVTANHFDDGFTCNGFGWVANCWEISLVKNLKPEVLDCLTKWLQNVRQHWPDTRILTQGEFGEAWRREHPDNKGLDYHFVQRGTGIGGSETNLEIRWFMNTDFRLAILRDWQKDEPGKVIDFTRYDLPAREPADPSAANPSRNWSLINRINQKNRRPEDAPVPLKDLTKEEQSLIKKRYPALFKCVAEASGAAQARPQVLSGASLIMKQQRGVNMFKKIIMALVPCALCGGVLAAGEMENNFLNPPDSARPGVYWYFMNGNLNGKEMTADLESMKAAGLGNLVFLEVDIDEPPGGPVAFMSPKWQELFVQSVRDAERLGIDITLGIGPGWCGSGGPWVKPEQSMQHLVFSSVELKGPQSYSAILPMPKQRSTEWHTMASPYYEDVALWAFPSRKPLIADIDEKALYYRGPYTLRKQVKPYLPTSARYAEPGPVDVIQPNEILDLTKQLKPDGTLNWNVPSGDWTIVRMGRRPTGASSRPAPSTALGLECDKFDAKALEDHLGQFVGVLLEKISPRAKEHGLTTLHMDSWESGAQNWTPSLLDEFKKRRGYDARPWLPVFTGRAIQSLEKSERFLWDLRLTGQELVLENHAGAVKKYGQKHGLSLSIEPYDMDPAGDLDLGAVADVPMAEFWNNSLESAYSCFEASSIGHVMGKPIVSAESFTSVEALDAYPWSLKNQGDWAFCVGINRFVFHTYAHQALGDAYKPGMTMGPYGVHWHRNQTWWPMVSAYHRYLTRCSELLRQGVTVSDVLYLTPEGTPQIFLPPPSALEGSGPLADKKGYGFDGCSPKILMARAEVKDGRVAFPGGSSYRLMVLPQVETMTPGLLAKIRDLVKAGATIVGTPPVKSPSLSGYPACDGEVQALAKDLWGSVDAPKSATKRSYGKGVIYWGGEPSDLPPLYPPYDLTAALLQGMGVKEDFTATGPVRYGHRRTGDRNIYFVSNRTGAPIQADCRFRVGQGSPQLWDPVTGEQRPLPQFERADGLTVIPMEFDAFQSFFVVFGGKDEKPVSKMGKNFADLKTAQELSGAWEVAFDPKWGGPEKITFGALQDWTTRPEPGIKYYSGIATYRKTLNLAQVPKGKTYLDLGVVHDMAWVRLNGQDLGVVWCAPWRVEVTGAIKAGDNPLEIEVVNRWANRLIGDKQPADADVRTVDCPPGFLGGKKFKAGRYTFSTHDPYNQQSPLVSSGLLGPVTLQTEPGPN